MLSHYLLQQVLLSLAAAAATPQTPLPPPPLVKGSLPASRTVRRGVSFVDINGDGYADLFNNQTGRTWVSVGLFGGNQRAWQWLQSETLPRTLNEYHYSASFGDYDKDGDADMATAPHWLNPAQQLEVLENSSGGGGPLWSANATVNVVDLAREFETNCWGDLDGDGYMDLFAPAYLDRQNNLTKGNLLLHNRIGVNGSFDDVTMSGGFGNPPACCGQLAPGACTNNCRPEGAMMIDLDDDGDLDIYCNGVVYQNISGTSAPEAQKIGGGSTGIAHELELEEGAIFKDVDMDGDFDLVVNYAPFPNPSSVDYMVVYGNKGDGTFYDYSSIGGGTDVFVDCNTPPIGNPEAGYDRCYGLAMADWDGDGDQDMIGRGVFRRNQFVETGLVRFQEIDRPSTGPGTPFNNLTVAASFADWDHDGDIDSVMTNWEQTGYFFNNTSYPAGTPIGSRPYLRIRPLESGTSASGNLETQFGAVVEVQVTNATDLVPKRRRQIVSSAGGYCTQDEYALTFGLEGLTDPEVDIIVDFPTRADGSRLRVDKFVNSALGGIPLSTLNSDNKRQIDVLRNGKVIIGGVTYNPQRPLAADLMLAGADPATGLALQSIGLGPALIDPAIRPSGEYIGVEFKTKAAPLAIRELIIDGILDPAVDPCGGNIALWNTTSGTPILVPTSVMTGVWRRGNSRTSIPVEMGLRPNSTYRLVAKVRSVRASTPPIGAATNILEVVGGLNFNSATGCTPATIDAQNPTSDLYMTLRFSGF